MEMASKKCKLCGASFVPHNPFQRYCCETCSRAARREKMRVYNKTYYNTAERKRKLKEYYAREDVKEHKREIGRKWDAANKEKVAETKRRYRRSDKGRMSDIRYKGGLAYRAARHRKDALRRFRKYNNGTMPCDVSIHWTELVRRTGSCVCSVCGIVCDAESRDAGVHPTVDHIKALYAGGSHTWDNVRLLCMRCNSYKTASDIKDGIEMRNQASLQGREMVLQQIGQGG